MIAIPLTQENIDRYKSPTNLLKHCDGKDDGIKLIDGSGRLAGYVAWSGDYITALEVTTFFRHQGLSTELVNRAVKNGATYLTVNYKNLPALSLYEKIGFRISRNLGHGILEMKKDDSTKNIFS